MNVVRSRLPRITALEANWARIPSEYVYVMDDKGSQLHVELT